VFRDEFGREPWKSSQMASPDGSQKSRRYRTSHGSVMVGGKFTFNFIRSKDAVSLMGGGRLERNRPEAIVHADASDDDLIVF